MYQLNERVSALFNKTKNCTLSTNWTSTPTPL